MNTTSDARVRTSTTDTATGVAHEPAARRRWAGALLVAALGAGSFLVACEPAEPRTCDGLTPTITGTAGNDTLNGTPVADVIAGLGGNDIINGLDGNDVLCGGSGSDTIDGGDAVDRLVGGPGFDDLRGGPGTDAVTYAASPSGVIVELAAGRGDGDTLRAIEDVQGSPHGDYIVGDGMPNTIVGLGGSDTLMGGPGNDRITAGGTNVGVTTYLSGDAGNDVLTGGPGGDFVAFHLSSVNSAFIDLMGGRAVGDGEDQLFLIENVTGTEGNDTIYGSDRSNIIQAGGGDDVMFGHGGNDTLDGGSGKDRASWVHVVDPMTVNLFAGTASGEGNDKVIGVDDLTGGQGNDVLTGNAGNNVIDGSNGTDTCTGGGGTDTLIRCP